MIKIAKDFRFAPGPRYIREGKNSGELFRQKILREAMQTAIAKNQKLTVDLDGTAGYGRSFLEEAFGGLIREDRLNYAAIKKALVVISHEQPNIIEKINYYLDKAHEQEQ